MDVLGGNDESVQAIGQGEPLPGEGLVQVTIRAEPIDGHTGRRHTGPAGHGERAAPPDVGELIEIVHAKGMNQGVVGPGAEIARRVIPIPQVLVQASPCRTTAGWILPNSCAQLSHAIVSVIDKIAL
jgi:hypothetical protein